MLVLLWAVALPMLVITLILLGHAIGALAVGMGYALLVALWWARRLRVPCSAVDGPSDGGRMPPPTRAPRTFADRLRGAAIGRPPQRLRQAWTTTIRAHEMT